MVIDRYIVYVVWYVVWVDRLLLVIGCAAFV